MNGPDSNALEQLAEHVVFAHETDQPDSGQSDLGHPDSGQPDLGQLAAGQHEHVELERVAALAAAAVAGRREPPRDVASRLAAAGLAHCAAVSDARSAGQPAKVRGGFTTPRANPRRGATLIAFLVGAAAASFLLWLPLMQRSGDGDNERAWWSKRDRALRAGSALVVKWTAGPELRGEVEGDVVWRQSDQDGWMTFRGLPKLDSERAYQLWVVDGESRKYPVDGGVFTIPDGGRETIVPIRTALPITRPTGFVVTVEGKQGVVVSEQEHIVATALL